MSGITDGDRKVLQALVEAEERFQNLNIAFTRKCLEQKLDRGQMDECKSHLIEYGLVEATLIASTVSKEVLVYLECVTEEGRQAVFVC